MMIRVKEFLKIRFLCAIATIFIFPSYLFSAVIFQDNFDNLDDWQPAHGTKCSYSGTPGCDNVPGNWTYYVNDEMWEEPTYEGTIRINSDNYRGGSGKGYTQWNESNNGNSGDGWGADGILAKNLGADYNEIYVRFYIKFQSDFSWGTADENKIKIFRAYHYDGSGNVFAYFSGGNSAPIFIFDIQTGTWGYRHISAFRCDPQETCYYCSTCGFPDQKIDMKWPGNANFDDAGQVGDGNWHCWEFHLKMNTKVGGIWQQNGIYQFWHDGELIVDKSDKVYMAGGDTVQGWNIVAIGGNAYNKWTDPINHGEQWYAIDDFVVSTTYIGPLLAPPRDLRLVE